MQESKIVKIRNLDVDMTAVISKNSRENLLAFARRMGLAVEKTWEKDTVSFFLKETIIDHPEYILYIHSKESLMFLTKLWESEDEIELTQADWPLIGQLQLLGFVDYSIDRTEEGKDSYIFLIREAKDHFYFYLKSKKTKWEMDRFHLWESLIRGIMTFYGIISFNRLYFYFCKCLLEPVDEDDLHKFLAARISLWPFGSFVMEKNSGIEYYQNFEVTNAEEVLNRCEENRELDYKKLKYDELIYVAENNGFGQWYGIAELADLFLENLRIEYYQTIVIIKSCILMVQNGNPREEIISHILQWYPAAANYKDDLNRGVKLLYQSVPVYELKGWSREEERKNFKNRYPFTVLKGGKKTEHHRKG